MAWLTVREARGLWKDAARLDDSTVAQYLSAAKQAIIAYAAPVRPASDTALIEDPDYPGLYYVQYADTGPVLDIPDAWRLAQYLQARNIYNAGQAPAGNGPDAGLNYSGSLFPLDWQVKQLIRPIRGVGAIA